MPPQKTIIAVGKRKTAVARAVLKPGNGTIRVNKVLLEFVQPPIAKNVMEEPILIAGKDALSDVDIEVNVRGGGYMGQAEAVRMAIARGLVKWMKSSTLKDLFRKYDRTMLSGDSRFKEPKKFGGRGARRRRQKSYR
ncbi:30S ribosomal protein S9 [Candidatus Bathyarchaeota archaeon]|nr:30S ribosomal protein S9 [Candidatus Bathyarchaeota archaeon]MBS7627946.1 30S ribosomal protein S9 [Candidatus Bathyarchaeota archaeon]